MITIDWLRQFRIEGFAIFDLSVSFLGVFLLSPLLSRFAELFSLRVSKKSWLLLTLPLSILIHIIVGNMTLMTKNFLDPQNHYILKTIIILLVIFGIKDVRLIKHNKNVK